MACAMTDDARGLGVCSFPPRIWGIRTCEGVHVGMFDFIWLVCFGLEQDPGTLDKSPISHVPRVRETFHITYGTYDSHMNQIKHIHTLAGFSSIPRIRGGGKRSRRPDHGRPLGHRTRHNRNSYNQSERQSH